MTPIRLRVDGGTERRASCSVSRPATLSRTVSR